MIKIYTDGSCSPIQKFGGFAFVVVQDGKKIFQCSGPVGTPTNNKTELLAIYAALKYISINKLKNVEIISDSQYCINGCNSWLDKWKNNGWKTASGPVKNREQWELIDTLREGVKFSWVRGHDTCEFNNLADQLAIESGKRQSEDFISFGSPEPAMNIKEPDPEPDWKDVLMRVLECLDCYDSGWSITEWGSFGINGETQEKVLKAYKEHRSKK